MRKINHLLCFACFFISAALQAQQINYTLNRDFLWGADRYYNDPQRNVQTFVKPYRFEELKKITDSTALFPRLLAGTKAEEFDKKAKGQFEVYPILNAEGGYDVNASRLTSHLAVGAQVFAWYGKKIGLNLKMLGGKQVFNSWQDSIVRATHVVPGLGYAYKADKDSITRTYAYQYFSGHLSWSPNRIFNIQLGQEKHFWGDGYRSLFLSDVSSPYPYLKITTNVWKLSYVNLYTIMKDATHPSGLKKDWRTKYATFHYLGWNATKNINVGIFEGIVWQGSDSVRQRGYDVNYLNPVLFFRPTEYSLGSSDNAFIGLSTKIRISKKHQLYGQFMLDEFLLKELLKRRGWWANKQAVQIGYKYFDVFTIKNLHFQTEYNFIRPYTYAHGSVQQNYGHMNEALAHPLGANLNESVSFLNYRYKRLFVEAKFVSAVYGADSAGTDFGRNIYISYSNRPSDYGHSAGQGFRTVVTTMGLRLAYILDTRMNLKAELGFLQRMVQTTGQTEETPYVFIGLKMDLCNLYNDY